MPAHGVHCAARHPPPSTRERPMTASIRRPWFGLSATLLGCLAVLAAVLPLWVLPVLQPPEPLDKVIVSTAEKVKARLAAVGNPKATAEIHKFDVRDAARDPK